MKIPFLGLNLNRIIIIILFFTLFCCEDKNVKSGGLIINEFLAINYACCPDDNGEYDDWVEIYNENDVPVNIGGMYFSDKPDDLKPYKIPDTDASLTTIPAEGYLVLWCDRDTEQGLLHLDLKLSGNGESVILIDTDGTSILDAFTYGTQTVDVSMGRSGGNWIFFEDPTPGTAN